MVQSDNATEPYPHRRPEPRRAELGRGVLEVEPEEEQAEARKKFEEVQAAYESLGGGAGDSVESWYENLGSGRADYFSGPVDLTKPIDGSILDYWTAAVCPLDAEVRPSPTCVLRGGPAS